MNAQLLRRLFKAINEGPPALNRVATEILDEQRRRGHGRLATQLEAVLQEQLAEAAKRASPQPAGAVVHELRPLSQRQELMVTITRPEQLQHHMVLAQAVEERFVRIEQEYAARDRLANHGLTPRRRVLLYGPPGCGKTLGAHRLAWTTALPLMQVRFDSLVSSLFGETASNLRKVFEHAQKIPSVLLLDECDYIAKSRTARHDIGEVSRIVNTLLQLLDEFRGPGLVVATTNIDRELDSALFRRFDDAFQVPAPSEAEIQRLLRMALSGMSVSKLALSSRFAKDLLGASAADIVRIAQDAAKLAVLEGARQVERVHFDRAKDTHNTRENPA
jgi:SpoVK/Ycf46/Vps4 family AAA+-type ATPase